MKSLRLPVKAWAHIYSIWARWEAQGFTTNGGSIDFRDKGDLWIVGPNDSMNGVKVSVQYGYENWALIEQRISDLKAEIAQRSKRLPPHIDFRSPEHEKFLEHFRTMRDERIEYQRQLVEAKKELGRAKKVSFQVAFPDLFKVVSLEMQLEKKHMQSLDVVKSKAAEEEYIVPDEKLTLAMLQQFFVDSERSRFDTVRIAKDIFDLAVADVEGMELPPQELIPDGVQPPNEKALWLGFGYVLPDDSLDATLEDEDEEDGDLSVEAAMSAGASEASSVPPKEPAEE